MADRSIELLAVRVHVWVAVPRRQLALRAAIVVGNAAGQPCDARSVVNDRWHRLTFRFRNSCPSGLHCVVVKTTQIINASIIGDIVVKHLERRE